MCKFCDMKNACWPTYYDGPKIQVGVWDSNYKNFTLVGIHKTKHHSAAVSESYKAQMLAGLRASFTTEDLWIVWNPEGGPHLHFYVTHGGVI